MTEQNFMDELRNIIRNAPVFPGNTLSHSTANECVRRGWAKRDGAGNFIPTLEGFEAAQAAAVAADRQAHPESPFDVVGFEESAL